MNNDFFFLDFPSTYRSIYQNPSIIESMRSDKV